MSLCKVSDAQLAAALTSYVEQRWTPAQFSEALGVSRRYGNKILQGYYRTNVPRPEGFAHPWPDRSLRGTSPERIVEALRRYREERLSIRAFARLLGVSKRAGWLIFHGQSYKEVERPELSVHFPATGKHKPRTPKEST